MPDIAIVILAAGESVRLGRPKQLLRIAGESLIRRTVRAALRADCTRCIVVLGAHAEAIRPELVGLDVEIVINNEWSRGIGTSIRTGIAHLATSDAPSAAMLMLGDQPLLSGQVLRRLLRAHDTGGKPITVASFAGTLGSPAIVDAEYFPALLALPDGQGAKSIWANHSDILRAEPCPEAELDIDTADDYERAVALLDAEAC